jgi:hypothetical protein
MICRNFLLGTQNVGQIRERANQAMMFVDLICAFFDDGGDPFTATFSSLSRPGRAAARGVNTGNPHAS